MRGMGKEPFLVSKSEVDENSNKHDVGMTIGFSRFRIWTNSEL
jgi:hypothetical protein